MAATSRPDTVRHAPGAYERLASYTVDTRALAPDLFRDVSVTDWAGLSWDRIGRPYTVEKWSADKLEWERTNGRPMSVLEGWRKFNENFQALFDADMPAEMGRARSEFTAALGRFDLGEAREALQDLIQLAIWNRIHRVEDAVWDPRGKRALYEGLGVVKPRILFLGAAEGYEAMLLAAMYPGAEIVLVDYDAFCETHRFGHFPEAYPFLGTDPATGHPRVWYREEMDITYLVSDIRDLKFGREFDIVLSVGLLEHFPDAFKPECLDFHRRFLKPGGWALMTTPRDQVRSRLYYNVMADLVNFGYRELLTVEQMGKYAWENGFDVVRAGVIKAHNGLVCKVR